MLILPQITETFNCGSNTVKIPLPEQFKDAAKLCVYHVDDGYVVFSADKFSEYILSLEELTDTDSTDSSNEPAASDTTPASTPTTSDKENPNSGVPAVAAGFVIPAVAVVLVTLKKTK